MYRSYCPLACGETIAGYARPLRRNAVMQHNALSCALIYDVAAQNTNAGDLYFQHITGLHPERRLAAVADTLGRSGGDDIAGMKLRELGAEGDDLRHRIDHLVGAGALHLLAVETRRQG